MMHWPARFAYASLATTAILFTLISTYNQWVLSDCQRHAGQVEYGFWTECFMKTPGEYQR